VGGRNRRLVVLAVAAAVAVAALAVAVAFGSRSGSSASVEESGVWPQSAPADVGLDAQALERLDAEVPQRHPDLLAVLVARDGRLAFERYYGGARVTDRFDLQSVTKTVVSVLVGIAIADGRLKLDAPLAEVFPSQIAAAVDPRVRRITLRHLLTMTSGWSASSPTDFAFAIDPVRVLLGRTLSDVPGRRFVYDNGSYHLLSAAVSAVTQQTAKEFAERRLFGPLGFGDSPWQEDDSGLSLGPGGLALHARDLAKLGQLFLNGGRWDGQQLVSERYVRESTRPQSEGGPPGGTRYGYGWWISSSPAGYQATGYGGQTLLVLPQQDLVVVLLTRVEGQTDIGSILYAVVDAVGRDS
jgi:CubicO group peptidase (beta-lactamase class C family)